MRMTISLTAILMEATGNISFALPLIVTFTCAKWIGDLFTEGIYDTQIAVSKVIPKFSILFYFIFDIYTIVQAKTIIPNPSVVNI